MVTQQLLGLKINDYRYTFLLPIVIVKVKILPTISELWTNGNAARIQTNNLTLFQKTAIYVVIQHTQNCYLRDHVKYIILTYPKQYRAYMYFVHVFPQQQPTSLRTALHFNMFKVWNFCKRHRSWSVQEPWIC